MSALPTKEVRVDLGLVPYVHQRAAHALRLTVRFLVLVWHRRAGKTVFAVLELLMAALACTRPRGRYAYVAPLLKQSKIIAWDYLKHYSRLVPGTAINEAELSVTLPTGTVVRLHGADNPDALRGGYLDGVVLDEVADMRPEVWGEIVRPMLTDRSGWALFIGTPKGVNLFSELYQRALSGEAEWAAGLLRAAESGVIASEEIEQARREMSASQFAQEFDCDFAASSDDTLMRLDVVLAAQARTAVEAAFRDSARILGVDVARYGNDKTVLFPRQGCVAFRPRALSGKDTMETASQVAYAAEKFSPDAIFVDVGGAGAGVVDRLGQLGVECIPVDFGSRARNPERFENLRAEMWWTMAEWVRSGCLPASQDVQRDLSTIRVTWRNRRGRVQLESKDDLRARGLPSPDFGDALATTFAAPVLPRSMRTRAPLGEQGPFAAGGSYFNPFER